jgi:ubiquinone/menaquinone biosynthesis C-methylase UbiE
MREKVSPESGVELGKQKKRVFIDLGSGQIPSVFWGDREYKGADYYIGIDNRGEMIHSARSLGDVVPNKENFARAGKNILLIKGDVAKGLPFRDNSVDEVLMSNIMGEFSIKYVGDFFIEARRVLKPDGFLIILETQTPNVTVDWRDSQGVDHIAAKYNFKKVREVRKGDTDFLIEASKYDKFHSPEDGSFVTYYRKE